MTHVARYIKNVRRISISMGPTEERGAALWVGYDLASVDDDLSEFGLLKADDETAARHGVTSFTPAELATRGIERKS